MVQRAYPFSPQSIILCLVVRDMSRFAGFVPDVFRHHPRLGRPAGGWSDVHYRLPASVLIEYYPHFGLLVPPVWDEDLWAPFGLCYPPGHGYRVLHPGPYHGSYSSVGSAGASRRRRSRSEGDVAGSEMSLGVTSDLAEFKVALDMEKFTPEDIKVKVVHNYIVIEGRHEEKGDEGGVVERQFTRKYLLPEGIKTDEIACEVNPGGILTIHAPKLPLSAIAEVAKEIPVKMVVPPPPPPPPKPEPPKEVVGTFEMKLPPGTVESMVQGRGPGQPARLPLASQENLARSHEAKAAHDLPKPEHPPHAHEQRLPKLPEEHRHHKGSEQIKVDVHAPATEHVPRPERHAPALEHHAPKVEHVLPIPQPRKVEHHGPTFEAQLPSAQALHLPLAEHHVTMAEHHLSLAERHVEKAETHVPRPELPEHHVHYEDEVRIPEGEARVPRPEIPEHHVAKGELHIPEGEPHVPRPEIRVVEETGFPSPSGHLPAEREERSVPSARGEEHPVPSSGVGIEHILPKGREDVEKITLGEKESVHERMPTDSESYQPAETGTDVVPGMEMGRLQHLKHQADVEKFEAERGFERESMADIGTPSAVPGEVGHERQPGHTSWGTPIMQSTGVGPDTMPLGGPGETHEPVGAGLPSAPMAPATLEQPGPAVGEEAPSMSQFERETASGTTEIPTSGGVGLAETPLPEVEQPSAGPGISQVPPPMGGVPALMGGMPAPMGGMPAHVQQPIVYGTEHHAPSAPKPMEPTVIVKMQPSGMSALIVPPGGLGGPHAPGAAPWGGKPETVGGTPGEAEPGAKAEPQEREASERGIS